MNEDIPLSMYGINDIINSRTLSQTSVKCSICEMRFICTECSICQICSTHCNHDDIHRTIDKMKHIPDIIYSIIIWLQRSTYYYKDVFDEDLNDPKHILRLNYAPSSNIIQYFTRIIRYIDRFDLTITLLTSIYLKRFDKALRAKLREGYKCVFIDELSMHLICLCATHIAHVMHCECIEETTFLCRLYGVKKYQFTRAVVEFMKIINYNLHITRSEFYINYHECMEAY